MGILEALSGGDDPGQQRAMTALAMGLLSGGNFNEALSKGLGAAMTASDSYNERALKNKLTNAQLAQLDMQRRAQEQQLAFQANAQKLWSQYVDGATAPQLTLGSALPLDPAGAGVAADPHGMDAMTAKAAGQYIPQVKQVPMSRDAAITNIPASIIPQLEQGGIKIMDLWKFMKEPHSVGPGNTVIPMDGSPTWTAPNLDKGMEVGPGGTVRNSPGYLEASGEQTNTTEKAKSGNQIITTNIGGRDVQMRFDDYQRIYGGQQQGSQGEKVVSNRPTPTGIPTPAKPDIGSATGNFDGYVGDIWKRIEAIQDPVERLAAQQAFSRQLGRNPAVKENGPIGQQQSVAEIERDKAQGRDFAEYGKNIINAGMTSRNILSQLDRVDTLLKDVGPTGDLKPLMAKLQSIGASMGLEPKSWTGPSEALAAIANNIAGGMRKPGTGAFTDKDFEVFLSQVPNLSKTPQGNKLIIETMRGFAQREKSISDILTKEFGGKYDNNAQVRIQQYIDENPVWKQQPEAKPASGVKFLGFK